MIPRRILLTVLTILLLLSPFAYSKSDSIGTRNDTVAIEVLEERVRGNAENTKDQIKSLQKLLDAQNDALNQRITDHDDKTEIHIDGIQDDMRIRTDSNRDRIDIYLGVAFLFVTLLGFVGYTAIRKWAKDRIEKMADSVFEKGLTDFKTRATKEVAGLIAEQTAHAEKQRRDIDKQAKVLFAKYRAKAVDRDRSADAVDTDELTEYTEKLVETKTEDMYGAKEWFLLGYEASERGDLKEAIRCYTNSIKLDPWIRGAHNNRGLVFHALKRYDEALTDYDKAIELDPQSALAYDNRANTLCKLKRYEESLKNYDEAIALDPKYASAYSNRGGTLNELQRYDEALEDLFMAIELDPYNKAAFNNRGNSLMRLGLYNKALQDCDKAIALDPKNAVVYTNRAICLSHLRRFDEALADSDRAIELDPKNVLAYSNRGITLCRLGRHDEALKSLDKALEIKPEDVSALQNAAEVRIILGQYEDALEHASKALTLSKNISDKAESLYLKCIAERLLDNDTRATEAEFERILKENFVCDWSFDEIERWLEDEKTDISEESREFIKEITDKLKAKKKKK